MLKRKQQNIMSDLKNKNAEPLNLVISCGPIKKLKWHSKINDKIKFNIYSWITCHPKVFQSPISNDYLKFISDDNTELKLVPKLLLQVFV